MSEVQTVVFSLSGQLFGAEASQVLQIIANQEVTKVPKMPEFIEGIINYRGTVVPIINLNKRFDMKLQDIDKKKKILLTYVEKKLIGFVVDEVSEIIKFTDKDIEPAPAIMQSEASSYLKKVGKKGDLLISIIDLAKVLSNSEFEKLNKDE